MSKVNFRSVPLNAHNSFAPPQAVQGDDVSKPCFSFEYLEGSYCLLKCTKEEQAGFVKKLHHMSKQTWGDLRRLGRDAGFEPIPIKQLNCKVPPEFRNEKAAIVFHMAANVAIIGFRPSGKIYYIIAIDRQFNAYKH